MIENIIIVALIFVVFIWAIVANGVDNAKSNAARENVRFNLGYIRIGMKIFLI